MAAMVDANGVVDGSATDMDCRARSSESDSTGSPVTAAAALVTVLQPGTGVLILLIVPGSAAMAPGVVQVAVTLINPALGITTVVGSVQILPF